MEVDEEKEVLKGIEKLLAEEHNGFQNLVSILQEIQNRFGYLPREGMKMVAEHEGVSPANVFGVATFYNQFRFTPPGKCHIKVCMGTACHIRQGDLILDQWKRKLDIDEGERTEDGEYSLERVACVGACAMAPVSIVCDEVMGEMAPTKVDGFLLQKQIKKEMEEKKAAKEKEAAGEKES